MANGLSQVDVDAWAFLAVLAVLADCDDEVSRGYIKHVIASDLDDATVAALDVLLASGLVEETDEGEWRITDAGRRAYVALEEATEPILFGTFRGGSVVLA